MKAHRLILVSPALRDVSDVFAVVDIFALEGGLDVADRLKRLEQWKREEVANEHSTARCSSH